MAGTRSSARLNANGGSQVATNKRKADDSPPAKSHKKGKTATKQQTLEDVVATDEEPQQPQQDAMQVDSNDRHGSNGSEDKAEPAKSKDNAQAGDQQQQGGNEGVKDASKGAHAKPSEETAKQTSTSTDNDRKPEQSKAKPTEAQSEVKESSTGGELAQQDGSDQTVSKDGDGKQEQTSTSNQNGSAIEEDKEREKALPSNVLEKGIIYFFTRGRVGIEQLESVSDVQRSHFVLRPLPDGAKITDGAMDDTNNNRLIAVPKKVWPKSGRDRFMAFVEKANASNADLKNDFLQGSEYETATVGTRQTPPVTPIGEGVYAITSTGSRGETHLAYMLTLPQEPGKLQEDVGIRSQGAFVMSLKNPESKGPAYASLPQKPDWPKEFIDEFHGRGWMPVEPKHLDYANAQILLIGQDIDGSALAPAEKDQNNGEKETPKEEMEKLEHEDEIRVKHLKGDDTIFADLGISKKEYPDVKTTW